MDRLPQIFPGKSKAPRIDTPPDLQTISYWLMARDDFWRAQVLRDPAMLSRRPRTHSPFKFERVVNLKVAKELGLKIPQSLLIRAAKVIK